MKKRIYVLFLLLMMLINLSAQQKDGTYTFLNATNSARVAALGGVMLPIYDSDIQLSTFNPSLINPEMNNSMSLWYVDYFNDINFGTVQYGHSFEKIGSLHPVFFVRNVFYLHIHMHFLLILNLLNQV